MKVALSPYLSIDMSKKFSRVIVSMSMELQTFFEDKNYGPDILELYLGVICVSPEFEQFFKPKRPRYDKTKVYEKEGVKYELLNVFQYDLKLDYDKFKVASEEEVKRMIANEILKSSVYFEKVKKADFDKTLFFEDLEKYFIRESLI